MNADIIPSIADVRSLCRNISEAAGMDHLACSDTCIFFESCRAKLRRARRAQRKAGLDRRRGVAPACALPKNRIGAEA